MAPAPQTVCPPFVQAELTLSLQNKNSFIHFWDEGICFDTVSPSAQASAVPPGLSISFQKPIDHFPHDNG
jgi:hypothetical protein